MIKTKTKILLVGCGKMGGALLMGWRNNHNLIISVLSPNNQQSDYNNAKEIPDNIIFDIIVMAVKPQIMTDVVNEIKHLIKPETLIISIAAGKTCAFFENLTSFNQPIIRTMPNTPAIIGQGMTVLCGNEIINEQQKSIAINLMSYVGKTEWIDDENLMNAVTAVSGSGPAYVFNLIESMAQAGINVGLNADLSIKLAKQTVIGAAALVASAPDITIETLRKNVTSKGGTTESALNILMDKDNGLAKLINAAVIAAKKRGAEL